MPVQIRNSQKDRGVTLIELLVSMIILALTLTGLLNLFSATKRLVAVSQSQMSVGEIGKFVLEPLRAQVREDQWGANCLSAGVGCAPGNVNLQNRNYIVTYTVLPNSPIANLNRVRIDLTWNEGP